MVETVTKFGTWSNVFGRRSSAVKDIAGDLRSLIIGLHPDTVEVPRKADKSVSFGFGIRKKNDSYCYLKPETDQVRVGFWWGASFSDINNLLDGRGKLLRYANIQDQKTARSAKVAHLIHMAIDERRTALDVASSDTETQRNVV